MAIFKIIVNESRIYKEGRVCLPDGLRVPNIPTGASLVEHVDRYYATMKLVQSYYGTFEEMEDSMEHHPKNPQVQVKKLMSMNRGS